MHPTLFCKKEILQNNHYDSFFLRSQDFELWLRLINIYNFDIIEEYLLNYRIPNHSNIESRIDKIQKSTYWAIKILNKNISIYILNLHFWIFYIKTLLIYLIIRLPKKIINLFILIKDEL